MRTTALRFHQFGNPLEVLRREIVPVEAPGPGQVLVRLLASPINPSDLGSIAGSYGELPALPAVGGREGVAEIVEAGPGVTDLRPGRRILLPERSGCWQELACMEAAAAVPVPDGVADEQAAMGSINPPTAWLLLESFVRLQPGDWVIQNAANSAVGHHVIQLCHQRGARTVNIVRRPEWVERLERAGADSVVLDGPDLPSRVREIVGNKPPLLGLNSVGGKSAIDLIKCLGEGGTLVTFGGMTGDPVRFPTRYLIFNDIRLAGFWLHRWKKQHSAAEIRQLLTQTLRLMEKGVLHAPVEASFPLTGFSTALERASSSGRNGKVLLIGGE